MMVDGTDVLRGSLQVVFMGFPFAQPKFHIVGPRQRAHRFLSPRLPLPDYTVDGIGPGEVLALRGMVQPRTFRFHHSDVFCLKAQLATGGDIERVHRSNPINTDPGDFVCILKDCDTLVVFRRQHEDTYALVGAAFIVALINGEAKYLVGDGKASPRWFELR